MKLTKNRDYSELRNNHAIDRHRWNRTTLNPLTRLLRRSWIPFAAFLFVGADISNGQRCDGTETFEKVSNAILRSAIQIPLYSSAGNTVTAECNNRCRSSNNCPAFLVNYETETCFRLDLNSDGRREDLVPGPLKVNFFEKICLQAPSCDRAWMFERVVGYELKGFDDMVINEVPTKTKCEELCIREKGIKCRSAEYDFVLRQCRLSREDRRTQPAFFQLSPSGNVDYLENQCEGHPPTYNCDYDAHEGKDLGRGDLQVLAPTVEECRLMCDETTVFNCRSFTYFATTKLCQLSGDDIVSTNQGRNALATSDGASFFQKSPCLDLSLTCTADAMTVHLNTGEPFEGRIYSQEHPTDPCEVFGSGLRKTEISFNLRNSGCGVAEEDKGVFTNVIVVQHHPVIQRRGDKAVKLFCLFETSNKTVTSSLALSSEASQGAVATAIVNATAPSPSIRLRITDAEGRDIVGAKLGERIYLRVEIDDDSIFGIFARNLVARSGSKSDSFTLLDERGCPTDPVIFPALEKVAPNSKSLVAPFEAFKFTADSVVRFQVNIQFCLPECLPARCGSVESYGRKRRRRSNLLAGKGPSRLLDDYMDDEERVYMSRLDEEDQDILFHETPLQKEIIVDSSAVVSPLDPDSDRHVSSTATGEMVCTTKSVVVASILSTAILQLCIVIVCVLCIQVHRKSTKDISPHPAYGMSASSRNHSHCSSPSMPVNPGIEITYGSNSGRACGYSTARRPIDNIRSSALRD